MILFVMLIMDVVRIISVFLVLIDPMSSVDRLTLVRLRLYIDEVQDFLGGKI